MKGVSGSIWRCHKLKHLGDIATQANLPPEILEQEAITELSNVFPAEENKNPSV